MWHLYLSILPKITKTSVLTNTLGGYKLGDFFSRLRKNHFSAKTKQNKLCNKKNL